jgi:hypothetical protein
MAHGKCAVPTALNSQTSAIFGSHSNLGEKISILVASAPQRFCTAWQTGRADPRSKLGQWRELTKPKYKAFDRWLIQ